MPDQSTAVAIKPTTVIALHEWDDKYRELVKRTVLKPTKREATNVELALFAEQVQRTQLNPFIGQIYAIYRWDSRAGDEVMQVQVGIDGFRIVAERTGKYEGQSKQEWCDKDGNWHDAWLLAENPHAARIGVYKTGRREPTTAVAHWKEYVQTGGLWKAMPANQLSKCAEALALRKAFPAELSGLYTPDEAARRVTDGDLTTIDADGDVDIEPLPPAVEGIIACAAHVGHRGLANRAAVAMAVGGQPEEFVMQWVADRELDLARFEEAKASAEADAPVDAVVVDSATRDAIASAIEPDPDERKRLRDAMDICDPPPPRVDRVDAEDHDPEQGELGV